MTETKKRPGRPATGAKPTRNVTLDADVQELLIVVQDKLEVKFGFRPTLSQTLRHLAKDFAA